MASIIRNGVRYGGGGGGNTNSIDISWEDYQALGDEKLSNNVTYYVTDGQSSGGGNSGGTGEVYMRYVNDPNDENFDYIQVRTAEGDWENYKKAYLERQWLVQDGLNRGNLYISDNSNAVYSTLTQSDGLITLYTGSYNDAKTHVVTFSFNETIDLTHYDKIVVEQTSTFTDANSRVDVNHIQVGVKDEFGNVLASYVGYNGTATYADVMELDVSGVQGVCTVFLTLSTYLYTTSGNFGAATCKISNVYAT